MRDEQTLGDVQPIAAALPKKKSRICLANPIKQDYKEM
jgi:hypothetical protein